MIFQSSELLKLCDNNLCFRELARFIAAGRLHCKIDKVKGIVETNRPDNKNWQYQVGFISQFSILLHSTLYSLEILIRNFTF